LCAAGLSANIIDMTVSNAAYHHPTPLDTRFEAMSLPAMFERSLRANPAAPFLHFLGRTYSYKQIYQQAQQFAVGLQAIGIAKGDRVGLFLPNVPIYAAAYYGAMMAGAVVVNFSPLYSVEELSWQVGDSGTRVLVTVDVPELYKTAHKVLEGSALETLVVGSLADQLPWFKGVALQLLKRSQIADVAYGPSVKSWTEMTPVGALAPVDVTPADLALLQYTGGTTGRPKGAMLGHDQLSINAQQVAAINPFGNASSEVFMGALPFFHVFANTALLNHACVTGASIAMVPRFETKQVLQRSRNIAAPAFRASRRCFRRCSITPIWRRPTFPASRSAFPAARRCPGRCICGSRRRPVCGWSKAMASPKVQAWSRPTPMTARASAAPSASWCRGPK
jgi:long-chain acyl-CoA synthetase